MSTDPAQGWPVDGKANAMPVVRRFVRSGLKRTYSCSFLYAFLPDVNEAGLTGNLFLCPELVFYFLT
jgi:hypothetical protein